MSAALALDPTDFGHREAEGTVMFLLSLRARGIFDTAVLRAMETVRRDLFAPRRFADLSRSDVALPLACGQTMTAPTVVAAMLAALDVRPDQSILEIGSGSGYVAALLAAMGARVRSIERDPILAQGAALRLARAGVAGDRAGVECGDGLDPDVLSRGSRYGRILLNGTVPKLSPEILARLAAPGILVGAKATPTGPVLMAASRAADGSVTVRVGASLRIAPLRERLES